MINIYTVFSWNIYKFVGIFLFILGIYSTIGLWGHIGTLILHWTTLHEQTVITQVSPHPVWLLHGSDSGTSTRGVLQWSRHLVSDAPLLRWCQAGPPAFPAAFLLTPCIEGILPDQMKPKCSWCVCNLGSKLNSNDSVCFYFLFLVSRYSYFPQEGGLGLPSLVFPPNSEVPGRGVKYYLSCHVESTKKFVLHTMCVCVLWGMLG